MSLFVTALRLKRFFALGLFLAFQSSLAVAAETNLPLAAEEITTPQQIYSLAQDRNGRAMEAVRSQINIADENGNTALCLAQQNKDKESYKMLLVFGASKDVECHDDTDPVCAIIVGEKLKVNGAGWLLGAAATAGAIYGITELIDDDDSCPSGYSKHYSNVASCGRTGAEGWVYEQHWKHKKCGKCTPKTYDTGCTTLWQSVNDCGEHPEGWNFEMSGYSGDEVCGICTPKVCPTLAETPTSVGSSTFYHTPGHCPVREYMSPENVVQVAYSGDKPCYRCDYKCDEVNGFAATNTCELNSLGKVAYECVRDAATQCYYRRGPKSCPVENSPQIVGSDPRFTAIEYCPPRRNMKVTSVTQSGWSGEYGCFSCHYECDGENGFTSETSCKTNTSGGEGYICQLDPTTQCYYRSKTATPDTPTAPEKPCPTVDTPQTKGAKINYDTPANCPFRKYMIAESVTPNGWSGENQCFNCNYQCDGENGFTSETTCKTNTSGKEGYVCQLDPSSQCYYRSRTVNPDSPDGGEKECPTDYSTEYQNANDCAKKGGQKEGWIFSSNGVSGEKICGKCDAKSCPTDSSTEYTAVDKCPVKSYKVAVAVNPVGYAGAKTCNKCVYYCDPNQRAFVSEEICETNAAGAVCEYIDGCYVVKDDCPEGYHTYIQNCNNKLHPEGWNRQQNGESNGLGCYKCVAKTCALPNVTDVSSCGASAANGWELIINGYAGDEECKICEAKTCPSSEEEGGCSAGTYEAATASGTSNYAGDTQCYTCNYICKNSYDSESACQAAASSTQYCKSETNNITCWYPVEYACPAGYTAGLKKEDCDTYKNGHYYEQTIVEPDDENSKGLDSSGNVADCYKCGFNCTGTHDGNDLVASKSELGYVYTGIWGDPTCYLKQLPGDGGYGQCVDRNGLIGSAYPQSYIDAEGCSKIQSGGATSADSWRKIELAGYYYAGEQCWLCASTPCSDQKIGTDTQCNMDGFTIGVEDTTITSGMSKCYTCNCDTANGYYSSAAEVTGCATTVTSLKNYNGKECFYCASAARALSARRDVINNQTLIINHADGDYYGNTTINAKATAPVTDETTGEVFGGNAEGSITLYNSASNANVSLQHSAGKNLYNATADGSGATEQVSAKGTLNLIMQSGAENTTAAAISSGADAYNAYAGNNASATGLIDITDTEAATNVIYGIQARRNAYNALADGENATAMGKININTATDVAAYGMYAGGNIYNQAAPNQTSIVNVTGSGKGSLYGLYSENGSVYNSGDVNVHASDGNAYGIYVNNGGGQIIDNSGNIIVASDTKTAYGIYVANGGEAGNGVTVVNSGLIDATGDANSRGIKIAANGANATVTNTGRIVVNGSLNNENTAIDLNGATLANSGQVEFLGRQNLDALKGRVAVEKGGKYKAEALSGDIHIAQSVVKEGFADVYQEKEAVQAENAGLNVISDSAMFKGSLSGNNQGSYDVVATRRNFNEFAPNESIANYLEENYKQQRLAELYNELKAAGTDEGLTQDILSSTGADFLVNLPQENLNALRNASEIIADSILTPTDDVNRITSGADAYFIDADGRRGVTGYETTAATAFMYGDKRLNNKNRLGLGLSFMQMNSSYDNGADRKENFISVFLPWLHNFTDKLRLASILNLGYGYGDYDRGADRDANITDFIYGLTNKLVYSINLADFAELEPALVLNAIGYYQDEMDEGNLVVKGGNHLSVEAGVGAYLKKELMNSKYGKLTARLGGMYYRELADPYHRMRAGFKGGAGTYSINDFANIYNRDRAVLSAMLDYEYKRIALYLRYHQLLQRNKASNIDAGIRYNF